MKLTFYEGSKICDERDQQLHFETETETFALWSQNLRLILILLKSVSNFETDTETFGRWSQSLRPALRPPWSQSQSRDQSGGGGVQSHFRVKPNLVEVQLGL